MKKIEILVESIIDIWSSAGIELAEKKVQDDLASAGIVIDKLPWSRSFINGTLTMRVTAVVEDEVISLIALKGIEYNMLG